MEKLVIICDKCGKEIVSDRKQVNGLDFCDDCYGLLCDVIQNWIDETENAIPVVEHEADIIPTCDTTQEVASDKKKIDWGKACALKKAGWTNRQIAEELNVNFNYINSQIYVKLAAYDKQKKREEEEVKRKVIEDR